MLFEFTKAVTDNIGLAFGAKGGGTDAWVGALTLGKGVGEPGRCTSCISHSSQQELSIKLSKLVVDLSQRSSLCSPGLSKATGLQKRPK